MEGAGFPALHGCCCGRSGGGWVVVAAAGRYQEATCCCPAGCCQLLQVWGALQGVQATMLLLLLLPVEHTLKDS
jgi:hypothetical protein